MNTLTLYPLSNYSFAQKDAQPGEDPSVNARLQRFATKWGNWSAELIKMFVEQVEGLMVVHEHGHPHVLLLQVANAFFKLPGDYLSPGQDDISGLQLKLHKRLGGPATTEEGAAVPELEGESRGPKEWQIKDLVTQWWRPNFESFMYPYIPAHISQPKEIKSVYLVQLPERQALTVPRNMKLIALPLFELYDNAVRYGPSLAAIPHLLSKYTFVIA